MYKNYLSFFLLLFYTVFATIVAYPQSTGNYNPNSPKIIIKGTVVASESQLPLEYTTVSLLKTDSTLVNSITTAPDGSFRFEADAGNYLIVAQFISYQTKYLAPFTLNNKKTYYDIGKIELTPDSKLLDEVTVTGEKSQMVISLDKKVFNVGKDLSNSGKSALEILDNVPSVTVDLDGNVSLRGSQNIQVLIDGKPSGLVSAGNTDALKNLPGNMIENVEVITNPSARYEAQGMGGIINIVLKKDQRKGVNGTFESTVGYPQEYSFGTNVNFRREKINYFVNYSLRYNERPGSGYSYQEFTLPDTSYKTTVDRDRERTGLSNQFRGGFDYFLNDKNTITAAGLFSYSNENNITRVLYNDYTNTDLDPSYTTNRTDNEEATDINKEVSVNYEKKFDTDEHKLIVISKYIESGDFETSEIGESQVGLINPETPSALTQRVANDETEKDLLLQADYIKPIGNKGKFESGIRSEFRRITNPYKVEELDSLGNWVSLSNYSNNFEYNENIQALYVQAGNNYGNFSVQLGLRGEYSQVKTFLKETNEQHDTSYFNLFPTLHTTYKINDVHSVQVSYSRRIQRPNYRMLNPFHSFSDSRNFFTGNPHLQPEYTHSFETGYLLNTPLVNFYAGAYYRLSHAAIQRVTLIDSVGKTLIIPVNLDESRNYGFESNVTLNPFKWWTLNANINLYRSITDGEYVGKNLESDDYSWNTRFDSKMRFKNNFDFQTNFFYRAPEASTQGIRKAFYVLNIALSKDVFKGNGTLTFNIRDVLDSRKFRFILEQPELYSENEFQWSTRSYALTFIYRLNQKKKGKGRNGEGGRGENFGGGDDMGF